MKDRRETGPDAYRGARRVPFSEIPMVDLAPLASGSGAPYDDMVRALERACRNVGFLYIRNHGVPRAALESAYAQAKAFFDLPEDVKMRAHCALSPVIVRGYVPLKGTHADAAARPDHHEAFEVGLELPADDLDVATGIESYGPNLWPDEMPAFRREVYAYYEAMRGLGERLFTLFARALDLDPDFFADKIDKPTGHLRLIHYPPQPDLGDRRAWGIGPHTDYECFTILAQDATGGLQVQNAAGDWIEALPIEGAFVINIGDLMARWTNDRFVSTPHRVIQRSPRERYSLAHFFGANYDVIVDCLETCRDPRHPPRYEPVSAGQWALEHDRAAYFGAGAPGISEASPRRR